MCSFAFAINLSCSSFLRTASARLLYLPLSFFTFKCTPQGLHRLRVSACTPLCRVCTALHKTAADSSQSGESFDTTWSRDSMIMSPQPDDASPADPNDASAMCSEATSGSTAEGLLRSIEAFPGSCMVASASAGISSVCSVAGRVRVERFLEVFPWSCNLFPKVGSKKAITVHASSTRSACIEIAVRILHNN